MPRLPAALAQGKELVMSDDADRSGGSAWLDALLYDAARPRKDILLDGRSYQEQADAADAPSPDALDRSVTS
jgi:hypothetical protein